MVEKMRKNLIRDLILNFSLSDIFSTTKVTIFNIIPRELNRVKSETFRTCSLDLVKRSEGRCGTVRFFVFVFFGLREINNVDVIR